MNKCKTDGCKNEVFARGYCRICYQIVHKGGNKKAGVYKITYEGTDFYYIGSSEILEDRKQTHKINFKKNRNKECPRIQKEFTKIKDKFGIDEAFKRLKIEDLDEPFDKGFATNCNKEDVKDYFYKSTHNNENGELKFDYNSSTMEFLRGGEEHWLIEEIKKDLAEGKKPILRCENKEYPMSKDKIFDENGELIRTYKTYKLING